MEDDYRMEKTKLDIPNFKWLSFTPTSAATVTTAGIH